MKAQRFVWVFLPLVVTACAQDFETEMAALKAELGETATAEVRDSRVRELATRHQIPAVQPIKPLISEDMLHKQGLYRDALQQRQPQLERLPSAERVRQMEEIKKGIFERAGEERSQSAGESGRQAAFESELAASKPLLNTLPSADREEQVRQMRLRAGFPESPPYAPAVSLQYIERQVRMQSAYLETLERQASELEALEPGERAERMAQIKKQIFAGLQPDQ